MQLAQTNSGLRRAGVALGIPLALLSLSAAAVEALLGSGSVASGIALGFGLAALLTLLSIWLGLPRHQGARWTAGAVAALLGMVELVVSAALVAALAGLAVLLLPMPGSAEQDESRRVLDFIVLACIGLGVVVAARGWRRAWRNAQREAQARLETERTATTLAQREKELVRSELSLLRAQVEPHFLWNTLAGVQYLTRKNPVEADRMIGHLIAYLQACVPRTRGDVTTVGSELAAVREYLELMKMRMGARLSVRLGFDEGLAGLELPPMLLGTLVENAIKHGLEPKPGPVNLAVTVRVEAPDGRLRVSVEDDGIGLQADRATRGTGIGLSNVRNRLQGLYGDDAGLLLCARFGGGTEAVLTLPARRV